jgi:hypothetical protein
MTAKPWVSFRSLESFLPTVKRDNRRRVGIVIAVVFSLVAFVQAQDFHFDSTISKKVLENYLNRSIHYTELLHYDINAVVDRHGGNPRDNIRAILNMGAKYVGRSIMMWGSEEDLSQYTPWLANAKRMIDTMHSVDPDIIFEAAEFEIIDQQVNLLDVPAQVFLTFDQPVVTRKFNYDSMLYSSGSHGMGSGQTPDMSKLEARMYYYFLACNYIDIGIEAFHFGQVGLMTENDPGYTNWIDLMTKVRAYGKQHARRHIVLCNAHTSGNNYNYVVNGKTIFDVNAFPMRIEQLGDTCCKAQLQVGYSDALYGKSKGGITPSGWSCAFLPWLAEFDNFGGQTPGVSSTGTIFIWGYDEITWIALRSTPDRSAWIRYAKKWMAANDTSAHLIMPGSRCLVHGPSFSPSWYWSNNKSTACPMGFNTEDSIKAIWGPIQNTAINQPHQAAMTKSGIDRTGIIMTLSGRVVRTLDARDIPLKYDKAGFSSLKLPYGVYLYSIMTASGTMTKGKFVTEK